MSRDLNTMKQIMSQKEADIEKHGRPAIVGDIVELARKKRFTFDIISIPVDPLR